MNEGLYCWVDQGVVVQGPQVLPQNWQDPNTGEWYMNVNNQAIWGDTELLSIGWYPYVLVDSPPAEYPEYYDRSLSDFVVQATNVIQNAIYTQWTIDLVREVKNLEMERQLTTHSANDVAVNDKIKDDILYELDWLSVEQANLARIDIWNEAAAFNTARPAQLTPANNFVGQVYVDRGIRMKEQNRAEVDSGGAAIWDEVEVDSFIAANRTAANDSSGNTSAQQPSFRLRQGVVVPSEQGSRIVIYRFETGDPNPGLAWNYGMRMTNRSDSRDIYVFSYTNGTYLAWNLFVQLQNGTWGFEGTPAEQSWVNTDMGFIFSYGTNPAVEADYFTTRVDFPAGVMEKNIFVAWDQEGFVPSVLGSGRERGRGRR